MADAGEHRESGPEPVGGIADATLEVRFAGYCSYCDRIVERRSDGSCPEGHPAAAVSGRIPLVEGEPVPQLPRFNLAAFLIPPIWGPAHGQWAGAFFLPIWLFVDSIIGSAGRGGMVTRIAAITVFACTVAFTAFFAKRANGLAYRRVSGRMSVDEYVAGQRWWIIASVPAAAAILVWASWFHFVFETASGR